MARRETKAVLVRLPLDLHEWIEKEAARTLASKNSEIVRCIRARVEAEQRPAGMAG
jgi:hypothetical protein